MKCVVNGMLLLAAFACIVTSCKTLQKDTGGSHFGSLRLMNVVEIPYNFPFKNTTVGGLSSIDYDAKRDQYYLICDDRSKINPARYYTARIAIGSRGIDSVNFIDVATLKQPDGLAYPSNETDPAHACDPEALRYDAKQHVWVWSSEGERLLRPGAAAVLTDPSVNAMQQDGKFLYGFELPANMHMQPVEKGPRRNGAFEGLTFSDNGRLMYVSVEEPIYEDGPRAGLGDSSAWTRLIVYDRATRKPLKQFAYRIDPVAHPPARPGDFIINGVPDILFVDKNQLLVTERSFSSGRPNCTIKLYLADLKDAADISSTRLQDLPAPPGVRKKLLLNLDTLGRYVDNIEGATFGPLLPNGHRTLLLVSDNNFDADQKTQFFLFEVIPQA